MATASPTVLSAEPAPLENYRRMLLILTGALLCLGLVMVHSAGMVTADQRFGSPNYFLIRHAIHLMLGCFTLAVLSVWDYHRLTKHWRWLLLAALILLILVLIPGIGTKLNGARRWISLKIFTLQSSEIAKVLLIAAVAGWAASRREAIGTFRRGFLPAAAIVFGAVGLIACEPDLGTAILVGAMLSGMLFVAGVRLSHALPALVLALPAAALLAWSKLEYIRGRWETFADGTADPLGKGYHINQAMIAQGSGGWFGLGLGSGQSKLLYLPESHNDFILSVIGEELGLLGAGAVICCFALLVWLGWRIAAGAPDKLGALIAVGVTLMIGLQALMHIAVVTHSMPTKGIGLPLVSYGGSSMIAMPAAIGLLLNVAGHSASKKKKSATWKAATPQTAAVKAEAWSGKTAEAAS